MATRAGILGLAGSNRGFFRPESPSPVL